MLNNRIKELVKIQEWRNGSTWEFDWYIDLIFCHAMAYGNNPVKISYLQPILDDEFLTTVSDKDKLREYKSTFFWNVNDSHNLINKQCLIIEAASALLDELRTEPKKLNLDRYYQTQYDLSLLMASVSVVFDKLIEIYIDEVAEKYAEPSENLSNHIISKSSVTALNRSNNDLLQLYTEDQREFDLHFSKGSKLSDYVSQKLLAHVNRYGWINSGERGKHSWDTENFLEQLSNILTSKKAPTKTLKGSLGNFLQAPIQINVNDNEAADLQVELDYLFQKYLQHKLGKSYNEKVLETIAFADIRTLIENPSSLGNYSTFGNTAHRIAYPYGGTVVVETLDQDDYLELKSLLSAEKEPDLPIRGRSACQGIVEGYVKVVRNLGDLNDFKEGWILVAEKTQPSYVMVMKKARGIVTDIGGITSHAAIISREFNIPCIVATSNATKILKDGDFVKVDAFTGEISKLR